MKINELIMDWFDKWELGDFKKLPISENFQHHSPFGTISGRSSYIDLVQNNKEKFLGYQFTIHDAIYYEDKACIRYTGNQNDFSLDVSEWYYIKDNLIVKIIAYYHIGEIREDRRLS